MLYSCLVDADYLNTEEFISRGSISRGGYAKLEKLLTLLDNHISSWWNAQNELDAKRTKILRACLDVASSERGLFSLTVPTGGGKTVSSMAFALNHAARHDMKRIIYVIPYTSIIEQTQSVFEEIFGKENVVAHYANVDYKTDEDDCLTNMRRLATENWDAPIILTTAVQFFESLYANRPSRCRKLHNIAASIIIFDEAQMLPPPYLMPCISAVSQLIKNYGCSAVLCTATQPSLGPLFKKYLPEYSIREICPQEYAKDEIFKRVSFINEGFLDNQELAGRLNAENQVLCIVNNRRHAQEIFSLLIDEDRYHLSTLMYPAHRRRRFEVIRHRLKSKLPCRVVSTSLVEAGVDLDFPTVYRAFAGLDSMIQAAGRCNREGRRPARESLVHLFESEGRAPDIIRQNIAAAEHTMRHFEDISSPEAVKDYFDFLYYTLKDGASLDGRGILAEIDSGVMPFACVAERFKIIDKPEYTVYIPIEEGAELVESLEKNGMSRDLMRKLGQYSVGVDPRHFAWLIYTGAANRLTENTAVLQDLSLYNSNTGLKQYRTEL